MKLKRTKTVPFLGYHIHLVDLIGTFGEASVKKYHDSLKLESFENAFEYCKNIRTFERFNLR